MVAVLAMVSALITREEAQGSEQWSIRTTESSASSASSHRWRLKIHCSAYMLRFCFVMIFETISSA